MPRSHRSKTRAAQPTTSYRAATRSPPIAESQRARAKLFANGRSQAVRLPKEFRMLGTEVLIHKEGDRIVLEPLSDEPLDKNGWPIGFWHDIDRLIAGIDVPDIEPMGGHFLTPGEIDPTIKWRK